MKIEMIPREAQGKIGVEEWPPVGLSWRHGIRCVGVQGKRQGRGSVRGGTRSLLPVPLGRQGLPGCVAGFSSITLSPPVLKGSPFLPTLSPPPLSHSAESTSLTSAERPGWVVEGEEAQPARAHT